MFRGLELSQLRYISALIVLIIAAIGLNRYVEDRRNLAGQSAVYTAAGREATTLMAEASETEVGGVDGLVNINTAEPRTLEVLPGIGPAKAKAIVDDREKRGAFRNVDDLNRVSGFGEKTVERLRDYITVGDVPITAPNQRITAPELPSATTNSSHVITPATPALVYVNRATAQELEALKGVGPVLANRIVEHRSRFGAFKNHQDLMKVSGIGPKLIENNSAVVRYDR